MTTLTMRSHLVSLLLALKEPSVQGEYLLQTIRETRWIWDTSDR
jgi:hypothetical protein